VVTVDVAVVEEDEDEVEVNKMITWLMIISTHRTNGPRFHNTSRQGIGESMIPKK
jgi:hypothetical protein